MKKDFLPYETTLELKTLGFNETCFGYRDGAGYLMIKQMPHCVISTPTYSQAFRWIRDNYELYYTIEGSKKEGFQYFIYTYENENKSEELFNSYEETELACLTKLIEIIKEKK